MFAELHVSITYIAKWLFVLIKSLFSGFHISFADFYQSPIVKQVANQKNSFNSTTPQSLSLFWLKILLNKLDTSSLNLQGASQEGYFVNFTSRTSV